MEIKLIKSTFYNEIETKKQLCEFIMNASHLSIWPMCQKFESVFSSWQARDYSVLVNSGSSANLVLIQALLNIWKIKKGTKVGFSGITWATNVMPIIQLWLTPIPIDVEITNFNCSLRTIQEAYEKYSFETLFLTNLLGFSDDIVLIREFCDRNGILLLEDNCESLWSQYSGIKLWNFWYASTFSLFVWHHMSSIEWWVICTDNMELYNELLKVRSHGWDRNLPIESQQLIRSEYQVSDFYAKYTFYDLGFNVRPTEITWFLGVNQMQYLDEMIEKRLQNFNHFMKIHSFSNDFYSIDINMSLCSNFAMPLVAKTKELMLHYVELLQSRWIEIRPIVGWLMTTQPFFKKYSKQIFHLPNCELIHNNGFYFGNNPEMTIDEIEYILNSFRND